MDVQSPFLFCHSWFLKRPEVRNALFWRDTGVPASKSQALPFPDGTGRYSSLVLAYRGHPATPDMPSSSGNGGMKRVQYPATLPGTGPAAIPATAAKMCSLLFRGGKSGSRHPILWGLPPPELPSGGNFPPYPIAAPIMNGWPENTSTRSCPALPLQGEDPHPLTGVGATPRRVAHGQGGSNDCI